MPNDQDREFQSYRARLAAEITDRKQSDKRRIGEFNSGRGHNSGDYPIAKLEIIQVPLAVLKNAPRQVRTLKKKQIEKVRRSVEKFHYLTPILIDDENKIVDGHIRLEVARQLGLAAVPCIAISHLSELEIRTLRIAINKTQESGDWNDAALNLEFEYLLEFETDLEITGFESAEIDMILEIGEPDSGDADPLDDIGNLPNANAAAVTQTGDIWQLREHRLLCGNARYPDDLDRLVQGKNVAMVFTDAPYNLKVNGIIQVSSEKFEEFAEASGEMSQEEFTDFLAETLGNAAATLEPGGLLYGFMDWRHMGEMQVALERLGLELINLCVWSKSHPGMGSFYRSQHELVFVSKLSGAPHRNNIQLGKYGRSRSNIWHYSGASGGAKSDDDDFSLHPTVKPVQLVADAILDATSIGETVLDIFLGSGTTLLAAERTRRRCIGLEISPPYVDVAIFRWQKMTDLEAVHAETGETFNERAGSRQSGSGQGEQPAPASQTSSAQLAAENRDPEDF